MATKVSQNTLFEIGLPDSPTATSSGVAFLAVATQAGGGPLTLNGTALLGLPTFTRIADDCLGDRCTKLADDVNEQIAQIPKINPLRPCDDSQPVEKPRCRADRLAAARALDLDPLGRQQVRLYRGRRHRGDASHRLQPLQRT